MTITYREEARRAGERVHTAATILLVLITMFAGIGVVVGIALIFVADSSGARAGAGILIGCCFFAWVVSLPTLLALQAFGRYVSFRATE